MPKVAVLLSIGRHPRSGWPRCAPLDQRAVEMALRQPDAARVFIHAGDPNQPILREYLGLGVPELKVLAMPPGSDPIPALEGHLQAERPDLVLMGSRGDGGRDTGMVPYRLATALDLAIVPNVVDLARDGEHVVCVQGLPGGHRRRVACPPPAIVTVSPNAPKPRAVSRRLIRSGRITRIDPPAGCVIPDAAAILEPAAIRPRRLRDAGKGGFADRLRSITGASQAGGKTMTGLTAEEAAQRVMAYLADNGCLEP